MKYRTAIDRDLPAIKRLTDEMLADTKLGLATSDKILQLVNNSNTNFDLAFDDDVLVGFMLGVVHEAIFNHVVRATDIGLYVTPSHRGSEVGRVLMDRFESWAKNRNVDQICLGQTTGNRIDITRRLYERRGYTVVGVNCIKEL
jgi:GNAT superfamily N-acetyltransferase